jgi:hypothetical protein
MRNSDPVDSGLLTERTQCRQFSPYNLTAATLNTAVGINGADPNPGIFTDYPTQAGALFQWINTFNPRYAWAPVGTVSGWDYVNPHFWWTNYGATHESCPQGYRRPTDGPTNDAAVMMYASRMKLSEMRQSLYEQPQIWDIISNDNSAWGYYADGFFDRREINNFSYGEDGTTRTAVAWTSSSVAHIGRVFFNKYNNASLFFPISGYRFENDGRLMEAGESGSYWSSSSPSVGDEEDAWYMRISSELVRQRYGIRVFGFSVRCVRE